MSDSPKTSPTYGLGSNGFGSREQVAGFLQTAPAAAVRGEVFAIVAPRSGLRTGDLTAQVYKSVEGATYDTVIVMASGKTQSPGRINIWSSDIYETDLGSIEVNDRLRNELCDEDDDIFVSDEGHIADDGIQAQVPFLQEAIGRFRIVPLIVGTDTPDVCRELGSALAEVSYGQRTLIVAAVDVMEGSSDAVEKFVAGVSAADNARLFALLQSGDLRLTGGGALMAAILAAQNRGPGETTLIEVRLPANGRPGGIGAVLAR